MLQSKTSKWRWYPAEPEAGANTGAERPERSGGAFPFAGALRQSFAFVNDVFRACLYRFAGHGHRREWLQEPKLPEVKASVLTSPTEQGDVMADNEERIRIRAYEIWEREGRLDGHDEHNWEQARREIEAEDAAAGDEPEVPSVEARG